MNYLPFGNNFYPSSQLNKCMRDGRPDGPPNRKTYKVNENNNQLSLNGSDNKIQEIWNKHTFEPNKLDVALDFNDVNMSWGKEDSTKSDIKESTVCDHEEVQKASDDGIEDNGDKQTSPSSPSHHARRPMNAFLIFCKKHRPIVRERFPNLENRGVTKILGEWWSMLDEPDKTPFTDLANEYKDAFLTANPGFKWYKLPAPPLRTLNIRPTNTNIQKLPSPLSSPIQSTPSQNEFTPGKLADESQLGSLTSLLNNNTISTSNKQPDMCCKQTESYKESNNNLERKASSENDLVSPVNFIKSTSLPPKPIKKRIFQQYTDNNLKQISRNILISQPDKEPIRTEQKHDQQFKQCNNMTNQDIVDKVVDTIFVKQSVDDDFMESKEKRKSGRQCKGKRYEQFMVEGKLLGNKKDTKLTQHKYPDMFNMIEKELIKLESKPETQTPRLENTIKRLAERTKTLVEAAVDLDNDRPADKDKRSVAGIGGDLSEPNGYTDVSHATAAIPNRSFNLDLRITNLPSLSYDVFTSRKRESKKSKKRTRLPQNDANKVNASKMRKTEGLLVGSKKRKNKQTITHLGTAGKRDGANFSGDLLGLATLAEVAASTQKINET